MNFDVAGFWNGIFTYIYAVLKLDRSSIFLSYASFDMPPKRSLSGRFWGALEEVRDSGIRFDSG